MSVHVSIDVSAIPARPAGAGRYVVELVKRLDKYDELQLTIFARRNDAVRWQMLATRAAVKPLAPVRRPLRLLWEQTVLPVMLSRLMPDVHLAPHYTMPELTSVPVVATVHDMTYFDHPEWHERAKVKVFRRAIKVAAQKAVALVAVSNDTANLLQARFGPVDVVTIPLGVDHERFVTNAPAPVAGDYIAFVGTIEPRKDLPTLVKAFDKVAVVYPDLKLVIAGGNGWGVDALQLAIDAMQHKDRVVRLGYVDDATIPALLKHAKAVAYPSLAEGFGLPALEALACGAALVTTKGTPMEEVVGDAALLVTPGDVDELATALTALLDGGAEVQRMKVDGPKVAARYTWDATAAAHVELLQRVADR